MEKHPLIFFRIYKIEDIAELKSKKNINIDRKQKFSELIAQDIPAYRAAIEAGYKESTAKRHSHEMKKSEKCRKKVEELKPIVKRIVEEDLKYNIQDVFNEFEEVRELALMPDGDGNYKNLSAAYKAIEGKARLIGAFEADNKQKTPSFPEIVVANERDKQALEDI